MDVLKAIVFFMIILGYQSLPAAQNDFSVLDASKYRKTMQHARNGISGFLQEHARISDINKRIVLIAAALQDIPYSNKETIGEGDWMATHSTYRASALHLQQSPLYRLDYFDCQSFVQTAMALLFAHDLASFDQHYLKISYGAAGLKQNIVHFYNRNHFVEADFNPLNRQQGYLKNSTDQLGEVQNLTVTINRKLWMQSKLEDLEHTIKVLNKKDGPAMVKRFSTLYQHLTFPRLANTSVTIDYLPTWQWVQRSNQGHFFIKEAILKNMPTPALVEIVVDSNKWLIGRKKIQDVIGTKLAIAHVGLLYRTQFKRGEEIYKKINCSYNREDESECQVQSIICRASFCNELMFVHATRSYPNHYYWYELEGKTYCKASLPKGVQTHRTCNRVETIPFQEYITNQQYGMYWYLSNPAILGIHVEKITSPSAPSSV
ncbi:MAG: DUF1460 domain-containing protein [Gammaproteobacteria bacterium]|nr:DUF1460 domain-containing protein [Gammaproteobacteria bacterium]